MTRNVIFIAAMALVTAGLRFLPFIIFRGSRKTPEFITYLGNVLPYATMGMLVVFCFKSVNFTEGLHGLPELVSVLLIVLVHWWKKNTMLSILTGTVCYVLIVNFLV